MTNSASVPSGPIYSAADIISDKVNSIADWFADAHVQAVGAAVLVEQPNQGKVPVPRTPGAPRASDAALAPAPVAGQDTRAILAEEGVSAADIERLFATGVAS